jgi:hypothetical protein
LTALGDTEAKLRAHIGHSSRWAIRFVLLKLGQSRGYQIDARKKGVTLRGIGFQTCPEAFGRIRTGLETYPTPVGVIDLSRLPPAERAEYEQLLAKKKGTAPATPVSRDAESSERSAGLADGCSHRLPGHSARASEPNTCTHGSVEVKAAAINAGQSSNEVPVGNRQPNMLDSDDKNPNKPATTSKSPKPLDPVWQEFLGGVYCKLRPQNRKRRRRR